MLSVSLFSKVSLQENNSLFAFDAFLVRAFTAPERIVLLFKRSCAFRLWRNKVRKAIIHYFTCLRLGQFLIRLLRLKQLEGTPFADFGFGPELASEL